jgi:hypothetical protein
METINYFYHSKRVRSFKEKGMYTFEVHARYLLFFKKWIVSHKVSDNDSDGINWALRICQMKLT